MEDQTRDYLILIAIKTLNISKNQAKLRIEALLHSNILKKFGHPKPDETLFQIITDIAMSIPQLKE